MEVGDGATSGKKEELRLLRILMMVNRDYGEREHAPAVQTLVVSFYS